jgi:RNA polymerase sigma-19 factor, ECF subfamily
VETCAFLLPLKLSQRAPLLREASRQIKMIGMKNNYSENELLQGFTSFDESCFEQLFYSFYPALCYFALNITGDQSLSEDIAEETLIKIWLKHPVFAHYNSLRSFLYTTAKNACLDHERRKKLRRTYEKHAIFISPHADEPLTENILRAEVMRQALDALETLPAQCKKIMKMYFVEGKETDEVAEEMKLSKTTVRNQKARGLMLMRKKLLSIMMLSFLVYTCR